MGEIRLVTLCVLLLLLMHLSVRVRESVRECVHLGEKAIRFHVRHRERVRVRV